MNRLSDTLRATGYNYRTACRTGNLVPVTTQDYIARYALADVKVDTPKPTRDLVLGIVVTAITLGLEPLVQKFDGNEAASAAERVAAEPVV